MNGILFKEFKMPVAKFRCVHVSGLDYPGVGAQSGTTGLIGLKQVLPCTFRIFVNTHLEVHPPQKRASGTSKVKAYAKPESDQRAPSKGRSQLFPPSASPAGTGPTHLCRFLFFRFLWLVWWLLEEVEEAAFWGFTP